MKKRIRVCICLYMCICMIYISLCFFNYFNRLETVFDWPNIKVLIIKEYPSFEGAKIEI